MSASLRFGFHFDRDYFIPYYFKMQYVYGVLILLVHAIAFHLLVWHTKTWARAVRIGYLLNQGQMLAHDVWCCFLLQGYTLLPYPGIFCASSVCAIIGGFNSFTIEHVFMVHSICTLLFMLLMMHQQIMPSTSKLVFPRWSRILLMVAMYTWLTLNPISAYLTGIDPPNKGEIINRPELQWVQHIATSIMLVGDIGNSGEYRYSVYIILISITLISPIRVLLVGSSVRFLKEQTVISSRAERMKRLVIAVLIKQTACVSIFYIYPLLVNNILFESQIAFLPDFLLVFIRITFVIIYMLNSAAQFFIMLKANKPFQKILQAKAAAVISWCNIRNTPPIIQPIHNRTSVVNSDNSHRGEHYH